MREIKFRAWHKKAKKMVKLGQITLEKGIWNYEPEDREFIGMSIPCQPSFILMQYTGLQDKNGKEIYEGDILPFTMIDGRQENYYIIFRDGEFDAINKQDTNFIWRSAWEESEVIGNIYDNPELLEKGKE